MEDKKLIISSAPHIVAAKDTTSMMQTTIVALMPSLLWAIYILGFRALIQTVICVFFCIAFEWVTRRILKRKQTVQDMSAVVTGIMLSFVLPVNLPIWMTIIGCFIAIVIVKQLFGGLGCNFANPTAVAGIVLLISFPKEMTTWVITDKMCPAVLATAATGGSTPIDLFTNASNIPTNLQMFFGFVSGPAGELSAFMILIGAFILIIKKVIDPVAPICFIGSVIIISVIAGYDPFFQVCAGGVLLGSVFMASDPVTTPTTYLGKAIFGLGCGVLTMFMRRFATYPDSMLFAILFMNILTPQINVLTRSKVYTGNKTGGKE